MEENETMSPKGLVMRYFDGLAKNELWGTFCEKCNKNYLPPKPVCINCGSRLTEWKRFSDKGTLWSYSIIHVAPLDFVDRVPYAVGILELEVGTRITAIYNGKLSDLMMGMPVQLTFDQNQSRGRQLQFIKG